MKFKIKRIFSVGSAKKRMGTVYCDEKGKLFPFKFSPTLIFLDFSEFLLCSLPDGSQISNIRVLHLAGSVVPSHH